MNKIVLIVIGMLVLLSAAYYGQSNSQYNMPDLQSVSRDRSNPTEMMVIYDSVSNKYIFEFIDK